MIKTPPDLSALKDHARGNIQETSALTVANWKRKTGGVELSSRHPEHDCWI
jgi:hypothetical protein